MPVSFLTSEQRERFGRYQGEPSPEDLARYFHLDDTDRTRIASKRGDHNRLGFAVQLGTVRYLGTFLDEGMEVPPSVIRAAATQLGIDAATGINGYSAGRWRLQHAAEIRAAYGYIEITEPRVGFRLTRCMRCAGPAPSRRRVLSYATGPIADPVLIPSGDRRPLCSRISVPGHLEGCRRH